MAARRNKLDYFPFFPKDCEADETIRIMDDSEIGFWVRLMCYQWPNGSVPSDPETLMRGVFGTAPGGVPRTLDYIREKLAGPVGQRMQPHPEREGRIADPRLLKEREIAENLIGARSKNGRAGAEARWKDGKPNSEPIAEPMRNADFANASASVLFCSVSKESKKEGVDKNIAQWEEFKRLYPKHRFDEVRAGLAWAAADDPDAILDGLKAWLPSESWRDAGGKYVNAASRFIAEGVYKMRPQSEATDTVSTMVSTVDPEIKRRLRERERNG